MARINTDQSQWFTAALEKAFIEVDNERYDAGWHHPSSLVHKCLAHQQFSFIGAKKERRPYILAYTSVVGTFLHQTIQGLVSPENHPLVKAVEEDVEAPDLRVHGRLDYSCVDPNGDEVIIDLKTIENIPKVPRLKDIVQVLWYMKMKGIMLGAIIYVRRSSGLTKRFTFEWKAWERVWEASRDSTKQITLDTIAGRFSQKTPESRAYCVKDCPYFKQCELVSSGKTKDWDQLVDNTRKVLANAA